MPRASVLPFQNAGELIERLGGINPQRIRLQPPPGQATAKDLLRWLAKTNRPCELVDGVLVEKDMASLESSLACDLIFLLSTFLSDQPIGFLLGEGGALRLMPGLVRIPDVSLILWNQLPSRSRPTAPLLNLAPALAVEVLSKGNTRGEMRRKLKEYFLAGVLVVWFLNPRKRTVEVFSAPDQSTVLTEQQTLEGGSVLPGLILPVRKIFAQIPAVLGKTPKKTVEKNGKSKKNGKNQPG